jgi:hypothetical protein
VELQLSEDGVTSGVTYGYLRDIRKRWYRCKREFAGFIYVHGAADGSAFQEVGSGPRLQVRLRVVGTRHNLSDSRYFSLFRAVTGRCPGSASRAVVSMLMASAWLFLYPKKVRGLRRPVPEATGRQILWQFIEKFNR